MSSIIVLDSSSDEDESPPKKPNLQFASSSLDSGISSISSNIKNTSLKQRNLPSGITITPHNSHGPRLTKTPPTTMQQHLHTSPLLGTNINHAINNLINTERQTATPPHQKATTTASLKKRKTPVSPPISMRLAPKSFSNNQSPSNIISPAAAATTIAPLPPIMPMITGVHSMAVAGATPPLQLLATPPQYISNLSSSNLNEKIMINPNMMQSSNLPANTAITTTHSHGNPNQNNINNNFKIHLPPKPVTPSPSASPTALNPKTTSPQLASPTQTCRARHEKSSKRLKPTTILKSTDDAWLQQRPKSTAQAEDQYHSAYLFSSKDMSWDGPSPSPESSKSSSRQQTPMPSPSLPKVQRSPDILQSTTAVFDLTNSPDKHTYTPIICLDDAKTEEDTNNQREKQLNGERNKHSLATGGENQKKSKALKDSTPKPPLEPDFEELIEVCRKADPSVDMNKLIKTKLVKYYYEVHGDFVKSKSFRKSLKKVVAAIQAEPDLVYYNLTTIVEELKIRRKAKVEEVQPATTVVGNDTAASAEVKEETELHISERLGGKTTNPSPAVEADYMASTSRLPPVASTGNKKSDEQVKKLNKAMYVLTKRIEVLEQADVDWDDEDSSFLQVERFKKRACQIYEKICDLTGESKNAHRLLKKPIRFNETRIPQFNKTLQAFINRTKEFPDYFDVLRMLEHCNRTYNLGLVNFEIKNIAEDAFIKVGKLLQSRRKADLYETVTHYGGREKDPAQSDPILAAKLSENQRNCRKINDILEKFARKQDMPEDEEDEQNKAEKIKVTEDCTSSGHGTEDMAENFKASKSESIVDSGSCLTLNNTKNIIGNDGTANKEDYGESEEDDEDDEDEDADLEAHVETLANGDETDNESENEISINDDKKKLTAAEVTKAEDNQIKDNLVSEKNPNEPEHHPIREISEVIKDGCAKNDATLVQTVKNNNNNINSPETKTVFIYSAKDSKSSPPNGKVKESMTELNTCNSNPPVTYMKLANANNSTTTTTTTADVRIVTVSSHNVSEILSPISSSKIFTETTSTPLDEIVISDEES